jgi:hypothetical protein
MQNSVISRGQISIADPDPVLTFHFDMDPDPAFVCRRGFQYKSVVRKDLHGPG